MSKTLFGNLGTLERALDYHLTRHSVLSSNVANAETPGYRSRDISFARQLRAAGQVTQARTNVRHLASGGKLADRLTVHDTPSAASVNGNTVSLEREMAKLTANSLRYQATTEMISRRLALLRYAASDGQRR